MKLSIENIELSQFPLSYPNSLLMVLQDFPQTAAPGESRPILVAFGEPTHAWDHRYDLIAVSPTHNGVPVRFETLSTPAGIKCTSEFGTMEVCFEDNYCLRIRSTGALAVQIFLKFNRFEQFIDRLDGAVQAFFRPLTGEFLFEAVRGKQRYKSEFLPDECKPSDTYIYWEPEDGVAEGYIAYKEFDAVRRTFTRSIEQCFEDNMASFKDFYAKTYKLPYEKIRAPYEVAAYMIWSNIIHDYGEIKGWAVYMSKGGNMRAAKGWHQAMHGMAAWRNLEFSLALIYQIPSTIDQYGMASGSLTPLGGAYRNPMPPIQGWALSYVVKRHGGWDCLSEAWAKMLYDVMVPWANWWREFSDPNGDGVIGYTNSDSSGWNDATMFSAGLPAAAPDIAAWMIVQMEACGHLAKRLGMDADADYWFDCSNRMLEDMINFLWDGEKFVAKNDFTGENAATHFIALYQVVMLGKRLPQPVIDKLVEALSDTAGFNAPQGFTTEAMNSPFYDVIHPNMCIGKIFAMANLYVTVGLYQAGAVDFALERARNWAEEQIELGPQTIVPGPPQTWEPMKIEEKVFDVIPSKFSPSSLNTWGCGVYLNIADMLGENYSA